MRSLDGVIFEPSALVDIRCGVPRCRHLLGQIVRLDGTEAGIRLGPEATEGAQWLVDAGHCNRIGQMLTLPRSGKLPVAPCPRHAQWRGASGDLRRGSARQLSEVAERTRSTVSVMLIASIDVNRVAKPIAIARRTGQPTVLLVSPADYADGEQLEPRRDLWQETPG